MATLLSSAIGLAISTGMKAGGEVARSAVTSDANPMGYFVDSLFRADGERAPPANSEPDRTAEVTRIIANSLDSGEISAADRQYLGQLVSANTGLAQAQAEQRVSDTFARLRQNLDEATASARQAADKARKASAALALWLVVSLFAGAFVASFAATFGGRLRDSSTLKT
jgi:hypothetical protein